MSHTGEELLIIYESEAEQWATYLRSVFAGTVPEAGICCCDITTASGRQYDLLKFARYGCKLLILSKGMLDSLGQEWRSFLARVLHPAAQVVVLLCGVESLSPLLELVPLDGDECLQISSEQDAHEYLATVTDMVKRVRVQPPPCKPTGPEQTVEQSGTHGARCKTLVVPSRVPCGSSADVFVLLKNEAFADDAEVEFSGVSQTQRVRPILWNERILCVTAPAFPAGNVKVTVYCSGVPLSKAQLQYYSSMEEITCLLSRVVDPVVFMCQALQVSSVAKLDDKLSSMMLEAMPTGGFPELQSESTPGRVIHQSDVPSLLHFAARYGLKSTSSLLLQCPGARRALRTADRRGQTPADIAGFCGHAELRVLLTEMPNMPGPGEDSSDSSVYEVMCATGSPSTTDVQRERRGEEEGEDVEELDIYAPLGLDDEYDTILNPTMALVIANRPPAPTPRPESTWEDRPPYITQVFLNKTKPCNIDLYSLPTKQARGREHGAPSTSVPEQINGLQRLDELQQRVKARSPTVDEALERFSDWHGAQKGMDDTQKEKLSQVGASFIGTEDNSNSVYDKINTSHQAPGVTVTEGRRGSQQLDVYSKPLKGPQSHFFRRADKE